MVGVIAEVDVLREAIGELNQLRQILQVVVKHGFGDLLDRARVFERLRLKLPRTDEDRSRAPAERVARMLTELGPAFIKMGQLLSTRPDLLPPEYIEALSVLQDHTPAFDFEQVEEIIREDLGAAPEKVFAGFEREPLASASIAQVHAASLHDGRMVVVKVRRPGIEQTVRSTLDVLYTLAQLLEGATEETRLFEPSAIVREFDRAIGREMDFAAEAENLRTFARNFSARQNLICPQPIDELCTERVLTMTRMDGRRVDELEPGSEEARQVALALIEGFYQQAFEDGFFHADPHPGNLVVIEGGRVGLYDFGQVARLTSTERSTLVLLGLGILLKDADTVARIVYRIGSARNRVNLAELKQDIGQALESSLEKRLNEINATDVLRRLVSLALDHRVRVPPEFTLAVKALVTVEGTVRRLAPGLEPAQVATPYVKKMLVEHYSLNDLRGAAGRMLFQLSNFFGQMPQQLSQILLDLECGKLSVQVQDQQVPQLRRNLRAIGMDLFWGLVAAGLLAGALPSLLAEPPRAGAWWAVALAGLIAATVTARFYLGPFWERLSLRQWLERRWERRRAGHRR